MFWNKVEAGETRKDAQLMRDFVLALPVELTLEQNIDLVREFVARELTATGIVADWAYHDLEGNPHVHLMTSLRPLAEDGFGPKRIPVTGEDGEVLRGADGKIRYQQFTGGLERLHALRAAWADIQNHHLAKHGHDIRVDHRSFEDLGIDAVPGKHRGPAADNMDARGEPSELMTKARHAARENYERYAQDPALVLQKITLQKAVFTRHDIAREIHKTECSREEFQSLFYRVGAHEELVAVAAPAFDAFTGEETSDARFSTRTMVELEHRMLGNIHALASNGGAAVEPGVIEQAFSAFEAKRGFALNEQQRMVVRHLTGASGASALVGYAGAGKSTAIEATRMVLERNGHTVVGGALAGIAADNLRSEAGIESRTLASWEYQWAKGNLLPDAKTVFVMDEAGMVSSRQMESITRTLQDAGAQMIVLGDARQLQPIQAGAAFRAFVDVTGYCELDSVVRQTEPWMREASVAFGSGQGRAGVQAYIDHDKLAWSDTDEDAIATLIADWLPHYQAAADVTIMAHRNKDVIALNTTARDTLKAAGALGEDHAFTSERGARQFAVGDEILFLQNERSLGVFNGSTGQVREASRNRLEVLVEGHADPITIRANEYNAIDHGYARTIHKEQGNTVDRSFVYLSPTMDAQLSYVALSRHREDVSLYAARDGFRTKEELCEMMSRDRLQDSTALYRNTVDHADVVRGFAERRGYASTRALNEFVRANVEFWRARFDRLAAAFARLRPPAQAHDHTQRRSPHVPKVEIGSRSLPEPAPPNIPDRPPEVSLLLQQSMNRLSHNLASERILGRKARMFENAADYELNIATAADELRRFNAGIRVVIPQNRMLEQGADLPSDPSSLMKDVPAGWQPFLQENWDKIFAAQWAEVQATLRPLEQRSPAAIRAEASQGEVAKASKSRTGRVDMVQPKILIEAADSVAPLDPHEIRAAANRELSDGPTRATLEDVAGRVFREPEQAVGKILARYDQDGDGKQLQSEVERRPAMFGDLLGETRLGIANADRRNAVEQTQPLSHYLGEHIEAVSNAETRIGDKDHQRVAAQKKPVPDLSPDAAQFVARLSVAESMTSGPQKEEVMRNLMSDKASIQEVARLHAALSERYGQGERAVRSGVEKDPAVKTRSASDQNAILERATRVVASLPIIRRFQEQVQQKDRGLARDRDIGRGIER